MKALIWNPILECDDDEGNPTVWAAEINDDWYGKFVWIEKWDEDEYHITVDYGTRDFSTLMICKSLTSAKRWVARKFKYRGL